MSSIVRSKAASEVCRARMTSTSAMTGTGFMKCMPTKRSGREVSAASAVMEIEDVLLARIDFRAQDFVGFGENGALDFEFFGNRFDGKVGGGDGSHIGDWFEPREDAGLFGFGQLPFFDFAIEILADGVERAVQVALVHVAEDDVESLRARRRGRCRCPWCLRRVRRRC